MGCGVGWLQIRLFKDGDADVDISPSDDDLVTGDGDFGDSGGAAGGDLSDESTFAELPGVGGAADAKFGFAVGCLLEPDDDVGGGIEGGEAGAAQGVAVIDANGRGEGGTGVGGVGELDSGFVLGAGEPG